MSRESVETLKKWLGAILMVITLVGMAGAALGKPWVVGIVREEMRNSDNRLIYLECLMKRMSTEEQKRLADEDFNRIIMQRTK